MQKRKDKVLATIKIAGLVSIPVIFLLVPTKAFENGPIICPFRLITGIPCPSCGSTRAVSCIFNGDFAKAWEYNKLIIITIPILTFFWIKYFYQNTTKLLKK